MTKSNLTLMQSGLLAVLLKASATSDRVRPASRTREAGANSLLEYPHSAVARTHGTNARRRFRQALCGNHSAPHLNLSPKQIAMSHQIHAYTELRQLDTLTRRGSNESIAAPQRALEQELGKDLWNTTT